MNKKTVLLVVALSVLLSSGISTAVSQYLLKPPGLVTFDMKNTMNAFIRQSAKMDLTDAQRRQLMARFDSGLTAVTRDYARENKVAIVVSPAVVTGLPDATAEIQSRLAAAMKQSSGQ